jgi:hypothetical protein
MEMSRAMMEMTTRSSMREKPRQRAEGAEAGEGAGTAGRWGDGMEEPSGHQGRDDERTA